MGIEFAEQIVRRMIMTNITVTDAEFKIIADYRKQIADKQAQDVLTLHCLETAARFEAWRQPDGRDMSYSTFLNEFEYHGIEGISQKIVYERVCDLMTVARIGVINNKI